MALFAVAATLPANACRADTTVPVDASRIDFRWGIRIPLRDGVHLGATLYLPKGLGQPQPCVFTLTPYIGQTYHDRGVYFAEHGYPFLTVDVRGRGNSEGHFDPMIQEAHDGYDVVEWLATQPYCNGKVAMWGGSYAGYDQWATAKELPPHLATIVPAAAPTPGVDFPSRRGIFTPYDMQWITYTSGFTSQERIFADKTFWDAQYRQWFESGTALREFDRQIGNPSRVFQEWLTHPTPDAYWSRYNPTAQQYARIGIPILTITGSYDENQPGALTHYAEHLKNALPETRQHHYLVIGPWDHAGTRTPKGQVGGLTFGPASLLDLPQLHLDWYAWTMRDGPKPDFLQKQVAYYVMGAERWRYADTLGGVTGESRAFYLDSTANANDVLTSVSLGLSAGHGRPDHYTYDPCDRSTAALESSIEDTLIDQRLVFAQRGKQLVYHTEPFSQATEVSGFFRLAAWLAIDQPDTDFVASLYELRPDGSAIYLSRDMLRARYREDSPHSTVSPGDSLMRYEFNHFTFVSREVQQGSRLRLVVGPLNSIYWEKNYNSGTPVSEQSINETRPVNVTLYHDGRHPSALFVPIGQPSAQRAAFVRWARTQAVPLAADLAGANSVANSRTVAGQTNRRNSLGSPGTVKAIDSLVGSARVVALGESSHGTHEPLAFRNRLLTHLVEDLGFTAIALETGFSESRRLYDFVLGATGEATSTAREGFTWGFGGFAENVELISWIRRYNADPSHRRKIHCYGIDLSGGDGGELTHARMALDAVERYLQRVAPDAARDALRVIDTAGNRFTTRGYRRLSNDERQALHAVIEGWASLFEQRRNEFVAGSSQSEYEWAHRNVIVASRIEQALQVWPEDPPQGLSPDLYKAVAIRDAAMADNVQWVLEREGPGARVLVFAHNAHVMNAATRGGIWKVYREAPAAMGQHLRSALGESLVIVGVTSAGTGTGLPAMILPPGGLDETLEAVGVPRFVLDLRSSNAPVVNAWLDEPQLLSAGLVTEHLVAPRKAFDAFVFFHQLTPAHLAGAEP